MWGRLWAAAAAHLVAAACAPDASVACLAVAHLRALAGRLLSQGELPHFTHQARALKPTLSQAAALHRAGALSAFTLVHTWRVWTGRGRGAVTLRSRTAAPSRYSLGALQVIDNPQVPTRPSGDGTKC